MQDTGYPNLCK